MDLAFVLDCEELYAQQYLTRRGRVAGRADDNMNAIARRIQFFKLRTLPAIKHFDDQGKLYIVGVSVRNRLSFLQSVHCSV